MIEGGGGGKVVHLVGLIDTEGISIEAEREGIDCTLLHLVLDLIDIGDIGVCGLGTRGLVEWLTGGDGAEGSSSACGKRYNWYHQLRDCIVMSYMS